MHTVRNRLASRPPAAMSFGAGGKGHSHAALRQDLAPIQRGSMAIPLVVPEESGLIEPRAKKRRNPKGKKARKAAARLAAAREAQALEPAPLVVIEKPRQAKPAARKGKARSKPAKGIRPEQLPAIPAANALQGTYSPPSKPAHVEPRAEALKLSPPVLLLPAPEPLIELPPGPAEPEVVPEPEPEPAIALADAPLPKARALVPARRQGLVDVIAFLLRDSGRRLARWSARRHKTRAERAALRQAEARQINLQRELEALDALRRNRG